MADLSGLSDLTTAAGALSGLVLATPNFSGYQPQNAVTGNVNPQAPGLLFHYEGENTIMLDSDITDHFVEDNTAIQDQIALKPEMINTAGFIGELNDIGPAALIPLKKVAAKLTTIGAYTPGLSATAILAYNEAAFLYATASTTATAAISAWSSLSGSGSGGSGQTVINGNGLSVPFGKTQTKQQVMFQQFYGYWRDRTLFTVQTPWAIFTNCAIKSLRAIQDAETNVISTFEVSFKPLRFASSVNLTTNINVAEGRLSAQASGITNLGSSSALLSPLSAGSQISAIG